MKLLANFTGSGELLTPTGRSAVTYDFSVHRRVTGARAGEISAFGTLLAEKEALAQMPGNPHATLILASGVEVAIQIVRINAVGISYRVTGSLPGFID
jgi:hypothetical protein